MDSVPGDRDTRRDDRIVAGEDRRVGAPRDERGVMLRALDQVEHVLRGVRDERGAVDLHESSRSAGRRERAGSFANRPERHAEARRY